MVVHHKASRPQDKPLGHWRLNQSGYGRRFSVDGLPAGVLWEQLWANPLQQMIGLRQTDRVALLEIHWPTSDTTQTFHDLSVNQAIEVTEFAKDFQKLDWKPIALSASTNPASHPVGQQS